MNSLQRLVNRKLRAQGLSRRELANRLGYQNTNKGLRHLDHYLETLQGPGVIHDNLSAALQVEEKVLNRAIKETKDNVRRKAAAGFKPFIRIRLDHASRPIFVAAMIPGILLIELDGISGLPFDEEISKVCSIYRGHHAKYGGRFPYGSCGQFVGFCYQRKYDEALVFDNECSLVGVDHHYHAPAGASLSVRGRPFPLQLISHV